MASWCLFILDRPFVTCVGAFGIWDDVSVNFITKIEDLHLHSMNVQSSPFRVLCGKKYTDFKKYIIVVVAGVTNIRYAWSTNQTSDRILVVPWYGGSIQELLGGSPRGFALAQYHDRFSVQEYPGVPPERTSNRWRKDDGEGVTNCLRPSAKSKSIWWP